MSDGNFSFTAPVIGTFLHLFEPRGFKGSTKDPKFSIQLVVPRTHQDFEAMRAEVASVARAAKPGVDLKTISVPWKNGDAEAAKSDQARAAKGLKPVADYMRGNVLMQPSTAADKPPRLLVLEGTRLVALDTPMLVATHKAKFYPGVLVVPSLRFVWHDGNGAGIAPGVHAYLQRVLSTNTGERLAGGGTSDDEVFSGYLGSLSQVNPVVTADEIPF